MRGIVFAKRTGKEILRDPLSYIFCLGFRVVMLFIMTLLNNSLPKQAAMSIFEPKNLVPGIAYFGLSFVMIFISIQLASDRTTSLLMRMHASPMEAKDYILGYTLPALLISVLQVCVTFAIGFSLAAASGKTLTVESVLIGAVKLIPSMLIFISLGLIIGSVFNEKAAPGLCSIIVTICGMLGGVWMPVDTLGGPLLKVSRCLPFYHGVYAARHAGFDTALMISIGFAVVFYVLSVVIIGVKWKKDVA